MLYFALNIYNEEDMIGECIDSIRSTNPGAQIVAVDGVYKSWAEQVRIRQAHFIEYNSPHLAEAIEHFTVPESTDNTLKILRAKKVEHIIECEKDEDGKTKPWEHEYIKRSRYFIGKTGDWYFVLDADERVEGTLDVSKLTDDAYNVMLKRSDDHCRPYPVLRIFRHQDGMHYNGAHHALWVGDKLYRRENCKPAPGISVDHKQLTRMKRDPMRKIAKGVYYAHLSNVEEAGFRAQHNI